jgi:glycosyltransferase involved in cell wall biosynthesis
VPFEVVVADNGSTDGTVALVEQCIESDPRVRLVDASRVPLGGAAAKNLGVEAAAAPLLAFCDADDRVAPDWLEGIRTGLQVNDVVIALAEYWELNPRLRSPVFRQYRRAGLFYGIPTIAGGAFGIRRDLYLEVGGFDETLSGPVDTEFGLRLFRHTRRAPAEASAIVHIRVPTNSRAAFRRHRKLYCSVPRVVRQFADIRPDPPAGPSEFKLWLWLMSRSAFLLRSGPRLRWMQLLGIRVGILQGRIASMPFVSRRTQFWHSKPCD